ncbi:MAG TPA: MEDS domain-containing protein [Candidatus Sulfotelmatobacter sp.]|nr:MEDS domain-containing protein [Candidatus Sulfotelmatobacter sp.]
MANKKDNASRDFGLELVGKIPWGTHLCQFYQTKQDLIDILVPYFKAGLENNEFCMWVTAEPLEIKEAVLAMEKVLPDFSNYLKKGQIEIISYKDWYLKGGTFDCNRVLNDWVTKLEKALKNGFDGLRLTGNTFWLEKSDWQAFTDYEEAINDVIGKYQMIAVCTYSLEKCNTNEIIDVIRNHQFALVKRAKVWEIIESSERKRITEDLRRTEQKFTDLYNSMTEGVALHDILYDNFNQPVDYVITDVNPSFQKITGLPKEQSVGKRASELYGTGAPPYLEIYTEVASSGKPTSFETYFPPMKKQFSVSVSSSTRGKFITVFHDITERKRAEEKIAQQAFMLENANDAIIGYSFDQKVTFWNKKAEKLYGYNSEQVSGRIGGDLLKPVYVGITREELLNKLEKEGHAEAESIRKTKDGRSLNVEAHIILLHDESGKPIGYVSVDRDITERKKIEEAIKKQADLIDLSPDSIIVRKVDGTITFWSKGAERLYGYTKEEAIGQTTHSLLKTKFPEPLPSIIHKIKQKKIWSGELIHHDKNLKPIIVQSFWQASFDKEGNITEVFESNLDITERAQLQEKLEENAAQVEEYANQMEELAQERLEKLKDAERLAAIGATAGMVGHDIRNPLQAIAGNLYLAKEELTSMSESDAKNSLKESLVSIEEQLGYINKIVTDLQDYAKPLSPCEESVDLEHIVDSTFTIVKIPDTIRIRRFTKKLKFTADSAFVKRILQNLVSNAVQAMPNGGELTIQTYREQDSIIISIQDTGMGIPENAKAKLFQPLFTTKAKGQGFGLAVCKKLTEAMSGTIAFDSSEGKGTKFTVRLPCRKSTDESPSAA